MSSIKVKKSETYTVIANSILRNQDMSMKAKGLLGYLLSLPNDWKIYKTELPNHFSDGKDAVYSAFDELVELGFITQEKSERSNGKFTGNNYTVSDLPQRFTSTGFTAAENPHLLITNKQSTYKEIIDNKLSIINADLLEIFKRWLAYKKSKRQAYKDDDSITTCYKKLIKFSHGDLGVAIEIIDNAIANNYAGFFPLKEYQTPQKISSQSNMVY